MYLVSIYLLARQPVKQFLDDEVTKQINLDMQGKILTQLNEISTLKSSMQIKIAVNIELRKEIDIYKVQLEDIYRAQNKYK